MNLKNYTSEVAIHVSMGKIEMCLVEMGATDISKKYENGICVGISFRMLIDVQGEKRPLFFKLPAQVDSVFKVFWAEIVKPREDTKRRIQEQAERTAWKILSTAISFEDGQEHLHEPVNINSIN